MRPIAILTLVTASCAQQGGFDGDVDSMQVGLEADELPDSDDTATEDEEPTRASPGTPVPDSTTETMTRTVECPTGGSVRVQIQRTRQPEPFKQYGRLHWQYSECGTWEHGTIEGWASFSRSVEGGPPWERKLNYNANLDYTGGEEGKCTSFVQFTQEWRTSEHRLDLGTTCPHPVTEWWGMLGL